jgi:hypothetical protein
MYRYMRTYPKHVPVSLTPCNSYQELEIADRCTLACLLRPGITTSSSERERLTMTGNTYGSRCTMFLTLIRRILLIDGEAACDDGVELDERRNRPLLDIPSAAWRFCTPS